MKSSLTILFCSLIISLNAQSNFVKAEVVTKNGEVLNGEIDYQEWMINPNTVIFRSPQKASSAKFGCDDIKLFRLSDKSDEYISANVGVWSNVIREGMLDFSTEGDVKVKFQLDQIKVFLQTLVRGKLNLYFMKDEKGSDHYFIQKENGPIEELYYFSFYVHPSLKITPTKYRAIRHFGLSEIQPNTGAMNNLVFSRNPENDKITSMRIQEFGHNPVDLVSVSVYAMVLDKLMADEPSVSKQGAFPFDLVKIVQKYNEKAGKSYYETTGTTRYVKPKDKTIKSPYFYGGGSYLSAKIHDSGNPNASKMNTSVTPSVGIGYDWGVPRTRNRLRISLDANYFQANNKLSTSYTQYQLFNDLIKKVDYELDLKGLRLNAYLTYNFSNSPVNFYVKGGIGNSFYIKNSLSIIDKTQNQPVIEEQKLKKNDIYFTGATGLNIQKFYIESRYDLGNDINNNFGKSLTINRLSLFLGYRYILK